MDTFGARLERIMDEKQLSAYKLSKMLAVGQSTISNYKKNTSAPKKATLEAIASILEVNPEWLESGKGDVEAKKIARDVDSDNSVIDYVYDNWDKLIKIKKFKILIDHEIEKAKNDLLMKLDRSTR